MPRGKSVTKLLLNSSIAALFAGIEIHNKPNIPYRYPTTIILIINAWELVLKAYVYKYISKKNIYENKKGGHTISFTKALALTRDHINAKNDYLPFKSSTENLFLLNEYRCLNVHFYEPDLDPVIFMLLSKAIMNYDEFVKRYFNKDITRDDNLVILPVGFKLPFDPIEYLKQNYKKCHNEFVNSVLNSIRKLLAEGIGESIVIGFDVYTASYKNIQNADIIASIDQRNGSVCITKGVRLTNNPNAPAYHGLELDVLPLTYTELIQRMREKRSDIKISKTFHNIMGNIKNNVELCQIIYLNPKKKSGTKKCFYSENAIDEIIHLYDEVQEG